MSLEKVKNLGQVSLQAREMIIIRCAGFGRRPPMAPACLHAENVMGSSSEWVNGILNGIGVSLSSVVVIRFYCRWAMCRKLIANNVRGSSLMGVRRMRI